jgi:S1-C subfamily serine protease
MDMMDQIVHSTIKIEAMNSNSEVFSTGTGFFFSYKVDDKRNLDVLVTNKHVVKDAFKISLKFTISNDKSEPLYGKQSTGL